MEFRFILTAAVLLFVVAVCLVALWRRAGRGETARSPICPHCEQRMGWSLTCRRCGRMWGSQRDLQRDLRAKDRKMVRQIRREEAGGR